MAFTKINAAGIGSTETVTLDGLTVINDGSFGGNVSVGGTLTYEDVTNIDSVGLITARAGVVVGSGITLSKDGDGFFTGIVTATSFAGDGSSLTGVASTENIRTNTNATFLQNINVSGSTTTGSLVSSGAISGTTGTFSGNITANGNIVGDDSTNITGVNQVTIGDLYISENIVHRGDDNTRIRFSDADTIKLETSGTERFQVDSSGNIYVGGVGGSATAGSLWFNDTSANASKIAQSNGNSALTFHTGSSQPERLRIDSAGAVRIGHTAAIGNASADNLVIGTGSGNNGLSIYSGNDSQGRIDFRDNVGTSDGQGIIFYQHTSDSLQIYTNSAEQLRIDSSGRLLLGTTSANHYSDRMITINRDAGAGIELRNNSLSTGQISFSDTSGSGVGAYRGYIQFQHNNVSMHFGTNNTERLRIDSGGKLIMGNGGTTNDTSERFLVDGSASGDHCGMGIKTNNNLHDGYIAFHDTDATFRGKLVYDHEVDAMFFHVNGSERMRISSAGYVTKPNNPAFAARTSNNNFQIAYASSHVLYDVEIYDAGGNYDTSNGRFTAPVNGYYYLQHQITMHNGNAGILEPKVYVNGSERFRHYVKVETGSGAASGSAHGIIYMTAGQYAQSYVHWSNSNLNNAVAQASSTLPVSFFTGYLVS